MAIADTMTVVRCPVCGSTRAGEDAAASAGYPAGYYAMSCADCGHAAVCDEHEIKGEWNVYVKRGPLPPHVAPTDALDAALAALRDGGSPTRDKLARAALRDRAVLAWHEPHRRYHAVTHLSECLAWFHSKEMRALCVRPDEVLVAIWLHDLVYDPRRSDNEDRSADEARTLLAAAGVRTESLERIAALIRATKTHVASTPDEAVLLDVDLAILGADPERFAEYERQIRDEYGWASDERYRAGRRAVLERFVARPRIFLTTVLHDRLEARARANLAAALA